ncbi:hypothetical protein MHK_009840, partial [Candidatus Magnetomorum sp. HK-1]
PPTIGLINDSTMDEDTVSNAISFTATDINEQALTITYTSSDTSLISSSGITFSGDQVSSSGGVYTVTTSSGTPSITLSITPESDQSGTCTITITVTDPDGMTSSNAFNLTIDPVNDAPTINSISGQTTDEEVTLEALPVNVTDLETSDCSFNITITSSDSALIPIENISYTCNAGIYYVSMTPTTDLSGTVDITITVEDPEGLTGTQTFTLTVNDVNDAPVIGSISDQTTLEDISTSIISLTATDLETSACNMTLTMSSSDQSLIPDEYLLSICSGNQYSIVATPAMNQYGTAIIAVTITDAGGLSSSTSFSLTVTDIDDSQYMWSNNQAADVVLGQADFSTNIFGTDNNSFQNPIAVAVDPTTGKLFISDYTNNRVLRFSSVNASINGSQAEAVFGQSDLVSVQANRGGSVAANTMSSPAGLYVDSFGRLWVTDRFNHRVLRFDNASSKVIGADADAVLGQSDFVSFSSDIGQNRMNEPTGVWLDPAGRLWVADEMNNRVLRFDNAITKANGANADGVLGQSNYTSNSSGTTQSSLSYPHIAFGDNAGNLFVVDYSNSRTLLFNNAALKSNGANADVVLGQSDFISNVVNTTADGMNYPVGVTTDNYGNIYVGDRSNNRLLIFNDAINKTNGASADYVLGQPDFTSSTVNNGGISENSLNLPHFLFFDNNNNHLWVSDFSNQRVIRYSLMIKTAPVISLISDSTMNEDIVSNSISFTVTDINEQALTITYISSNESLISPTGITFSGDQLSTNGSAYTVSASSVATTVTLSITPETNQSGTALITITVTDTDGMTATDSFSLTVAAVNDVPNVSTINPQSMNEGTSIALSLTATDTEGDSLSVTALSADQSLIQNSDIVLSNDGSTYTISITPMTNQAGSTDITISVDDGTDITHMTFMITVNEVYYMIAGHVSWYTDIAGSDFEGVTLTLSGTYSYSMLTDASGYYTFTTVRPGNYTLTASKSDDISLEIADAIKILKAGARKISLTCLEQIAADVYNDGYFGAYDASRVLDYLAGFENCMNDSCTFWQFVTENITSCETWPLIEFESVRQYTDLTGDALGQDFIGIGCGNVSE